MNANARWLVCEGRCNPSLIDLDNALARYRHDEIHHIGRCRIGKRYPVDDDLAARLRRLEHTEHVPLNAFGRWKCTDCGQERNYGRTRYSEGVYGQ